MATSGSTNYSLTRSSLALLALQLAGVYGIGRTVSDEDSNLVNNLLNMQIKTWATKGLHLWSKERAYLFPVKSQASYLLGSTAKACLKSDAVLTTTSAAHSSGVTTINLTSSTGMAINDVIGIVMTGGAVHYSTIASVPDSTSVTINAATTAALPSGTSVYTYTTALEKPLRVHSVRRLLGIGSQETSIPMEALSDSEYDDLPTKAISGVPTTYNFQPDRSYGQLNVWPTPSTGNYYFEATVERTLEDVDAASDDFDFPQEWLEPITYQLAYRVCLAFGRTERAAQLLPIATDLLNQLISWDSEIATVQFIPESR